MGKLDWSKNVFSLKFCHFSSDILDERKRRLIGDEFYKEDESDLNAADPNLATVDLSLPVVTFANNIKKEEDSKLGIVAGKKKKNWELALAFSCLI